MYEVAPILERCRIFHVPGNMKFAVEGTNDDAALHTENAAITPAGDSLTSVNLTGYEIVKLVKASRACSEMALSAFESYVVEIIAESIARKIENYIFTGTGSNQPGGVKPPVRARAARIPTTPTRLPLPPPVLSPRRTSSPCMVCSGTATRETPCGA